MGRLDHKLLVITRLPNIIKRNYSYRPARIQPLAAYHDEVSEITLESQQEALKNSVAPLWNTSYSEQLQMKEEWISYVVSRYFTILQEQNEKSKKKHLPKYVSRPQIRKIIPSPVIHQYRNKDVYVVRPGIDGNPKTVGHIVGRTSKDSYVCIPPVDVISPPQHIQVAKDFQNFIRMSHLPACTNYSEGGNWTQLHVRSNRKGETMALVKIHPQQLTQAEIEAECGKLKEYFQNGPGSVSNLSSLFFQSSPFSNASGKTAPFQLLFGDKYLVENLSGRKFALSPSSFFQCNVAMAEIMYDKILSSAKISSLSSILDLGCGIGTISILASPLVRGTVGIDFSEEAIQDAKLNARMNNIFSANFIAGKIEANIKRAIKYVDPSSDVVAILNPGRCGVDVPVINELRCMPQIGRLIYVSCQPDHEWVIRNVLHLIKSTGKVQGTPFSLRTVLPVDMFPQTTQCELIMCFER